MDSRSADQLTGKENPDISKCSSATLNKDMGLTSEFMKANGLQPNDVANPCGLLAKYFPKDDFELEDKDGQKIEISDSNISIPGLKGKVFKHTTDKGVWMNVENERFINWTKPSSIPFYFKLWGKISIPLKKGDYT